ncbi:unnamed protein product [Rotaria sordida]|uniref:Tyramine beta-hydroxylase n=1 Tax=Rotaria sordida TaxID=392033 RepID=A0A818NCI0_9BILA|nr:unnamed protein product [Rotaria sordida]CAF0794460.1 unnamed protein product [Rotaria sordida]CAF3602963.1 unnamed protein product [Rotaria sordida]CAF3980427.1 unnamed protein product [Rotaria sordida]
MLRSRFLLILFTIKIILCVQGQVQDDEEFSYMVGLSEPLRSTLEWNYYENDATRLIFRWNITLLNNYGGILAFSNHDLNTNNLDVIILSNDEKIYNAYTDENSLLFIPKNRVKLSYTILHSGYIKNKKEKEYSIQIIRPIDTCDKEKRNYIIDSGTTHLLTGLITYEDFQKLKQNQLIKIDIEQMNLTLQRVQLLKTRVKFRQIPDEDPHIDFLNQDVTIPNVETTYWCTRFKLPSNIVEKPHHIIRFDGVISPQSNGIVHHMELFHCDVSSDIDIPEYNGVCTSEQKPMGLTPCRRVIGAWALGATNFTYPDEAGGLIGEPRKSSYVILEVHFNNQYLKKGIVDQSGIRIYYTSTLRKYDAGIMEVGLEYNAKNSIPPQTNKFRISGYCTGECTEVTLPKDGITVFASQLHTHLNGIQTFTRIIKTNGEIITLNIDRHYSPHFQEIRLLPEPILIKPGDMILHTCIYNTQIRTNMTFGGYGITDEMCVNYMHYYPRTNLELCKTSVRDDALDQFFETMKEYDYANTSMSQTVYENYRSIRWTPLTTAILQEFYEIAPIHLSCNGSDGNYSPKFEWTREYRPQEPKQRDVPLETAAKCV